MNYYFITWSEHIVERISQCHRHVWTSCKNLISSSQYQLRLHHWNLRHQNHHHLLPSLLFVDGMRIRLIMTKVKKAMSGLRVMRAIRVMKAKKTKNWKISISRKKRDKQRKGLRTSICRRKLWRSRFLTTIGNALQLAPSPTVAPVNMASSNLPRVCGKTFGDWQEQQHQHQDNVVRCWKTDFKKHIWAAASLNLHMHRR